MTTHIMLDLETWGKRPGCDIRSIGAVVFDPVAGMLSSDKYAPTNFYIVTENPHRSGLVDEFFAVYPGIETPEDRKYPLIRDPQTVKWWNDQSPEAQAAFANPVDLYDACILFTEWLDDQCSGRTEDMRLWANGPQFDVSILEAIYHAVGLPVPWHYRAPRDMRTITDAAGMSREEFSKYGDPHNALHDAIAQAMTVCEAYKRLGLAR